MPVAETTNGEIKELARKLYDSSLGIFGVLDAYVEPTARIFCKAIKSRDIETIRLLLQISPFHLIEKSVERDGRLYFPFEYAAATRDMALLKVLHECVPKGDIGKEIEAQLLKQWPKIKQSARGLFKQEKNEQPQDGPDPFFPTLD